MQVAVIILNNSIVLHFDGRTVNVAKGDGRYEKIVNAYREKRIDDIPAIVDPSAYFKKYGATWDEEDMSITVKGEKMPKELTNRILAYQALALPFDSLMKFWENLKQNPSLEARRDLFKFLENKGHAITEEGYFTGYRGVTSSYKDIRTGTFCNAVDSVCEMPRASVDSNPNNTCSHGLHVGGYQYAKDFGRAGKLMVVRVHPRDVVAVPTDYNGQKMRVCRFEVIAEAQGMLEHIVTDEKGNAVKVQVTAPKDRQHEPVEKVRMMSKKALRAHKQRYSNNHAKRGKDGKFAAKKFAKRKRA